MMRSFLFPERMCSGRDFPGMEDPFLRLAAGTLLLESPDLAFGCAAGQISVAEILEMKRKVDAL